MGLERISRGRYSLKLFEEQQYAALRIVNFLLSGESRDLMRFKARAGTGKTYTLSNSIKLAEAVGGGKTIGVISLTGRAVSQLRKNGVVAHTIHSLLYDPVLDDSGDLVGWTKTDPAEIRSEFFGFAIDEASMLTRSILEDVLSIGLPVIVVGDDAQLPSIGNEEFNIMDNDETVIDQYVTHDDVTLKINRRTDPAFSGIIKIMNSLLDGGGIPRFCKADGLTFTKRSLVESGEIFRDNDFDIVLCGTNAVRRRINNVIRKSKGFDDVRPSPGETIMCLNNTVVSETKLYNGVLYEVTGRIDRENSATYFLKHPQVSITILDETFINEKKPKSHNSDKVLGHFTYGYCTSVHKAQGSTFDSVLFVDEDVSGFLDRTKFRYTAVSRAAKHLTIAR